MAMTARTIERSPTELRTVADPRGATLSSCYRLTFLIAALLVAAAGAGLLGVYRDNEWVASQMRGQDFVSLLFALPLLLVSRYFARRGSVRALLVWLGALGYLSYSYLYIFGVAWNGMFLIYLTLLFLSASTLVRALTAIDVTQIRQNFSKQAPTKAVARFLIGFGVVLGVMWGVQALVATFTGEIPASVISSGHPTAVVYILDLGLVVPLFLIGGRALWRQEPWGFILAGLLLVKGVTEGLALLGMSLFMYLAHHPDFDIALVPLWAAVALASAYLSFRFYGAIRSDAT